YFVTEFLQGETLRAHLDRSAVSLETALSWSTQIAQGLAAAHDRGIVHRDLKPENVLVTRDGHVNVLDFGIAKALVPTQEPEPPVRAGARELLEADVPWGRWRPGVGMVVGAVGCMSPEQVRGEPLDARSDLFSLGSVLHELLSRRRAFPGASAVE